MDIILLIRKLISLFDYVMKLVKLYFCKENKIRIQFVNYCVLLLLFQ